MRARAALLPLLCAAAAAAAAPPPLRFPQHSWAHVPVFVHTSQQQSAVFSPADTAVLARYAAITIEKWQGCATGVTQQAATLAAAAAIRKVNPNITIYSWLDSMRIYSNRTLNPHILDISNQSCVRPAGTPFLETHPVPYELHAADGSLALESYLHAHVFDHSQAPARRFWQEVCTNLTATGLIDGCGADASQQDASYIPGLAPDVAAAWQAGRSAAVAATTAALAPHGGVVLGKDNWQLGTDTNGVLQEQCTAANATILLLQNATAAARAAGVRYVYECHCSGSLDELAAFLVGAGQDHYWGFGPWLTWSGGYAAGWLPEFDKPLGAPLADGSYDAATATWTRRFASGTVVTFDAASKKGAIAWGAGAPRVHAA